MLLVFSQFITFKLCSLLFQEVGEDAGPVREINLEALAAEAMESDGTGTAAIADRHKKPEDGKFLIHNIQGCNSPVEMVITEAATIEEFENISN